MALMVHESEGEHDDHQETHQTGTQQCEQCQLHSAINISLLPCSIKNQEGKQAIKTIACFPSLPEMHLQMHYATF